MFVDLSCFPKEVGRKPIKVSSSEPVSSILDKDGVKMVTR
jgi:hypothetical protein